MMSWMRLIMKRFVTSGMPMSDIMLVEDCEVLQADDELDKISEVGESVLLRE